MHGRNIEQHSQDKVQPMIILYKIHKHGNSEKGILFTDILMQTTIK